jgi:hypothetical protein
LSQLFQPLPSLRKGERIAMRTNADQILALSTASSTRITDRQLQYPRSSLVSASIKK